MPCDVLIIKTCYKIKCSSDNIRVTGVAGEGKRGGLPLYIGLAGALKLGILKFLFPLGRTID